jgi:hypothetical protein
MGSWVRCGGVSRHTQPRPYFRLVPPESLSRATLKGGACAIVDATGGSALDGELAGDRRRRGDGGSGGV